MLINGHEIDIYCDGADTAMIQQMRKHPDIGGFTTNPSLARKAGVQDYLGFCRAAQRCADGLPISFEVLSESNGVMETQAKVLSDLGDNVYVKIPVVKSNGETNIGLIGSLAMEGMKINATAVFTWEQMHRLAVVLGSTGTPSIISVFAGRIADAGVDAESFISNFTFTESLPENVQLLWASPRESYNVIQAARCGCDIITLFPTFIDKLKIFGKDLETFSRETSAMFVNDADEAGFSL